MSKIIIKNARLSFPSLFEHEIYNNEDTGKFAATLLIPKDHPIVPTIEKAVQSAAEEKFGKPLPKGVKFQVLMDGDEKDYDGYEGHYSIKASTKKRPVLIERDKTPIVKDDKLYAGCFVNASISIWVMDNKYGKKVLANLNAIQFFEDGDPLSGGVDYSDDDFEELEAITDDEKDPFSL